MKQILTSLLLFFSGLFASHTNYAITTNKLTPIPTPTINCQQVHAQMQNTGNKYTVDEYVACALTPTPIGTTVDKYLSATPTQEEPIYTYPTDTPEPEYRYPTSSPTPDGLQGQIQLHSDYTGGLVGQDSNGNQVHLHSNFAGGYQGQDSNGNQVRLNPNYAGGYNGTDSNNTFHCNPNYANGYNCN